MSNDTVAHALSGAGGGILSTVVTYPLITLSTRAQTESARSLKEDDLPGPSKGKRKKVTAMDAARQIIQREGISGLYSGLESALFGISITNFVYYYFYEGTKTFYPKDKNMTTFQTMAAGAIAGSATVLITNPIWVVNTRMTVKDGETSRSTVETIKDMLQKDGIGSFFSGIGPALVLVINPILQYTIFEQLKNVVQRTRKLTAWDAFILGAIGKIIATSVTYPYITLKSRLQLRQNDKNQANKNLIDGIRQIISQEGVSALYKGINTKVLQSALTSAFLFFFKEQLFAVSVALLALIRRLRKSS